MSAFFLSFWYDHIWARSFEPPMSIWFQNICLSPANTNWFINHRHEQRQRNCRGWAAWQTTLIVKFCTQTWASTCMRFYDYTILLYKYTYDLCTQHSHNQLYRLGFEPHDLVITPIMVGSTVQNTLTVYSDPFSFWTWCFWNVWFWVCYGQNLTHDHIMSCLFFLMGTSFHAHLWPGLCCDLQKTGSYPLWLLQDVTGSNAFSIDL